MKQGYLNIVLHAHLPYVRHPEYDSFFEENWLFEAISECYIPLIRVFDRLENDAVNFTLTLSLSPTLITMVRDELLQSRYQQYLNKRIELAEKEIIRTRKQPHYQKLARLYRRLFIGVKETYQRYNGDLLCAFKKHHVAGHLELITTAATHGFLPVLNVSKTAVQQQIEIGIATFTDNLGFSPTGFWLPECGFYPELENSLASAGIHYFFTDTHALLEATDPVEQINAPINCGNAVMAFARNADISQYVWSSEYGYPSNNAYREYYDDIGFELALDYIAPYILDGKNRVNTGIKYHRIAEEGSDKQCYAPHEAREKINRDAKDFVKQCQQQLEQSANMIERPVIITVPFDAELFGHWWFEGPEWLDRVFRLLDKNTQLETTTAPAYLKQYAQHPIAMPAASSWGDEGYSSYWINEENDWIYPFLHQAAEQMEQLVVDFKHVTVSNLQRRALNQALRSVWVAQASDWSFIMKAGTATDYAKKRLTDQLARFNYLHECIRKNRIDEHYLLALETMDNIFPAIDFKDYSERVL